MSDHGAGTRGNRSQEPPPSYPVNGSGLTYGSLAEATTVDNGPDLVLVVAANGRQGYARRTDIEPYQPRSHRGYDHLGGHWRRGVRAA